ncbi:MAG: hypothetical protein RIS35_2737 [Pseudomonadota bacterium]
MKASLQLRFSQHLALTPQLQQSIRLLQLSTQELNQELEQIIADNPLLERTDDFLNGSVRLDSGGGLAPTHEVTPAQQAADPYAPTPDDAVAGSPGESTQDDGERDSEWGDPFARPGGSGEEDDPSRQQIATTGRTLREHLRAQLAGTHATPIDRTLVGILIDNLDDDGRLDASLEEIAEELPEMPEIGPETLSAALKLLQSFDPPGVGARDLSECLLLQLDAHGEADARTDREVLDLARTIVRDHLELLAARDFTRLRKALRCDDERLRAAHALIRRMSPHPGASFTTDEPAYVVPDVVVRKTRTGWQAELNPEVLPRLHVNEVYAQALRRNRQSGELSARLQEARWLVKNIRQRFETILRVSQAIVEQQRAFFSHGAVAMRPLVLREIADELGLHESTISRVTTHKYMLTPHGTVELKYFFGSHVATESGGAASSTAIRALIRQLIEAEDPKNPLSDGRLAELLGEQGIVVARRTVAKYRESSNIPAVAQRKSL